MKKFYTDQDIEELFHNGVKSLPINDDIVLTDLAFEKARKLGLFADDAPPAAPVRPYLSEAAPVQPMGKVNAVASAFSQPQPALASASSPNKERREALEKRIREKVIAKLGDQIDARLLDVIIKRSLKATGLE